MAEGLFNVPAVRDFLLDAKTDEYLEKIATAHNLPEDRTEEFLDLTDAVILGKAKVADMSGMLAKAFALDDAVSKKVAIDLAGYRLLPLEEFLPGIEKQIKAWGGDASAFPSLRVTKEVVTTESTLEDFVESIGLELPEHLMKRFVYLSRGYITKERAKDATATLMKRPMNIGGLGLSDAQIELLLQKLDGVDLSKVGQDVHDLEPEAEPEPAPVPASRKAPAPAPAPEGVPAPPKPVAKPKPAPKPAPAKPAPKPVAPKAAPKPAPTSVQAPPTLTPPPAPKKQPVAKKVTPPAPMPKPVTPPASKKAKPTVPAKTTTRALTDEVPVISGELMDEHEEREIQAHKERVAKTTTSDRTGELDVATASAAKEVTPLFTAAKQSQKTAAAFVRSVLSDRIDSKRAHLQLQQKYGFDADAAHKAMTILEAARTQYHGTPAKPPKKKPAPVAKQEKEVLNLRHAQLTKSVAKESVEPVVASARVSAARSTQEELSQQKQNVDQAKVAQAKAASKPKKAKVKLSKPSAPPKAEPQERKKVSDVRYTPKLAGPVEELGTMTIADFRRLSSDPKEAINKVSDTLDLLEDDAYEQRIKGVKAWRKNPLNGLYLTMVNQALMEGVSVAEVASSRRNKGEESLSPAEVAAIVGLNQTIKF